MRLQSTRKAQEALDSKVRNLSTPRQAFHHSYAIYQSFLESNFAYEHGGFPNRSGRSGWSNQMEEVGRSQIIYNLNIPLLKSQVGIKAYLIVVIMLKEGAWKTIWSNHSRTSLV